jgi:hypothetical protein
MMHPTAIWDRPCSSTEAERLRLAHKAFTLGLLARLIDMPISACPFGARSYEADAWENGWGTIDVHLSSRESVAEAEPQDEARVERDKAISQRDTLVKVIRDDALPDNWTAMPKIHDGKPMDAKDVLWGLHTRFMALLEAIDRGMVDDKRS